VSNDQQTIGFIGLGAMGGAVARRLAAGGFPVKAYDLNPQAVERAVALGAVGASSAEKALDGADVVITSLPTPELVEAFWADLAGALASDTIVVDTSTIDPVTSRRVADHLAAAAGAAFVACTLGKTPGHAENGEIPAFVGGPADAVRKLGPVLGRMASSVHDMGSVEGATIFKLISNLVGMSNLAVLAEGFVLARAAGISSETFTEALKTTGGWSVQADLRLPWIAADDLDPRFAVNLAAKDLRLSTDAAARWSVPTPVGSAALSAFVTAAAAGHGGQDAAAVVEALDPQRTARDKA
jgi:3-hydroxyisobutyrate dehydrogenase